MLTLAHESLARAWPRLRGWLDEDQEGHRILRHLTAAAESWSALERPDTELYRGVRLARTLEWQGRAHPDLTGTEDDFLTRSRQLADEEGQRTQREVQRRRRTRRRNAGVAVAAAMLAVVAGLTTVLAAQERDRAAEQRDRAEAEALASTARRAATLSQSVEPIDQALLLGVEAVRRVDSRDSRNVLLSALTRSPALQGVIATTAIRAALTRTTTSTRRAASSRSPTTSSGCTTRSPWSRWRLPRSSQDRWSSTPAARRW